MVAWQRTRCDFRAYSPADSPLERFERVGQLPDLVSLRLSVVSCTHRGVDRAGLSSLNKELLIEKCYEGAAADAQSAWLTVAVWSRSVFEN